MIIYSYGHLLVITGYFYAIIHSINGVFLVLITGTTRALTVLIYKCLKCFKLKKKVRDELFQTYITNYLTDFQWFWLELLTSRVFW